MSNLSVNTIRFSRYWRHQQKLRSQGWLRATLWPITSLLALRYQSSSTNWINRDRFYSFSRTRFYATLCPLLLPFWGLKMLAWMKSKNLRQWGSKAPGHPEWRLCRVDATNWSSRTRDFTHYWLLKQERFLAAKYNRERFQISLTTILMICGDGDLMEGVSSEAASYAGLQKLDKLVVLLWFKWHPAWMVRQRFLHRKCSWQLQKYLRLACSLVEDGTNLEAIHASLRENHLWLVKTVIGCSSQANGELMPYTVLLLEQMKLPATLKLLVGIMNHLKFRTSLCWFQGECCEPWSKQSSLDKFSCEL